MMGKRNDGGYYAIKGFLYQFDRTLIEVIRHPETEVAFENRQDIDYDDYVLQIKHKESQDYAPYKIRKAVCQLLSMFKDNPEQKFVLYCHFRNRAPQDWTPSLDELESLLGKQIIASHSRKIRIGFLMSFKNRFSEDYESQFRELIGLVQRCFCLKTQDEVILYQILANNFLICYKKILR